MCSCRVLASRCRLESPRRRAVTCHPGLRLTALCDHAVAAAHATLQQATGGGQSRKQQDGNGNAVSSISRTHDGLQALGVGMQFQNAA